MAGPPAENSTPETKPKRKPPKGRPFAKGVSGNPGGRPKEAKQLREALALHGDELVTALLAQVREGNTLALLRALEYVLGKPPQAVEVTGAEGGALQIVITTYDGAEE